MATDLYERTMAFNFGDPERYDLMKKVWSQTPWMIDVYSGGHAKRRDREMDILQWCYETFGEQARPIHDRPGTWQRGSATINGWTWFGFSTEADMRRFMDRWPTPEGVSEPNAASITVAALSEA